MVAGTHVAVTDVMLLTGACTVTIAVPDLVVSWTLVAVTVTAPATAGAVNNPLAEIVPPVTDQVTAEL
jgi:hypothetical protein